MGMFLAEAGLQLGFSGSDGMGFDKSPAGLGGTIAVNDRTKQ